MRGSSTRGVDPTRSSSDRGTVLASTSHRREQDELIPVRHRRLQAVPGADVLAAEVDVHEGRKLAVLEQLRGERWVALDEVVDDLGDRGALRVELARAADLGAQRGRDANGSHQTSTGALQNST